MVKFRCKRSGNHIVLTNENDITSTRLHEGYEEVIEKTEEIPNFLMVPAESEEEVKKESKRRGRPPRPRDFN